MRPGAVDGRPVVVRARPGVVGRVSTTGRLGGAGHDGLLPGVVHDPTIAPRSMEAHGDDGRVVSGREILVRHGGKLCVMFGLGGVVAACRRAAVGGGSPDMRPLRLHPPQPSRLLRERAAWRAGCLCLAVAHRSRRRHPRRRQLSISSPSRAVAAQYTQLNEQYVAPLVEICAPVTVLDEPTESVKTALMNASVRCVALRACDCGK